MAERSVVKSVANCVIYSDGTVRIDNVRLSYPHLAEAWAKPDPSGKPVTPKFSCKGLIPYETHRAAREAMEEIITRLCTEKKIGKIGADKKFVRKGEDVGGDENENQWVISASETRRPSLRTRRGAQVTPDEAEDVFYPGCYVNLLIRPWAQDNDFGKRVNAGLVAVQFLRAGERFGEAPIDDEGVFEDLGGDDGMGGAVGGDDDL